MTHRVDPFLHPTDLSLTNTPGQQAPTLFALESQAMQAGKIKLPKMGLRNERKIYRLRCWDMGFQGGPRTGFGLF